MPSERHRTRHRQPTTDGTARVESNQCPECTGSLITNENRGDTTCGECGLVIEQDAIDRGPEWRAFDTSEREAKSRVGAPMTKLMHDEGLSTTISWQDKDAHGRLLSPRQREQMRRLRTWNERFRTRSARERNLKQALGEIDRMASALGLPRSIRETAGVVYRRALEDDLLLGRSIEGVATAALYAAARLGDAPRSLDEMTVVSRVDRAEIARTYRFLLRELSLAIEPADPEQFVPRFASTLEISDEAEHRARELLRTAKSKAIHSGKSPVGLAAAAVYAASILTNERITQSAVSDVADISEVTIRNRYHELLDAEGTTDG